MLPDSQRINLQFKPKFTSINGLTTEIQVQTLRGCIKVVGSGGSECKKIV